MPILKYSYLVESIAKETSNTSFNNQSNSAINNIKTPFSGRTCINYLAHYYIPSIESRRRQEKCKCRIDQVFLCLFPISISLAFFAVHSL